MANATGNATDPKAHDWLKLYNQNLEDTQAVIFTVLLALIITIGAIFAIAITCLYIQYKSKYYNYNDLYTSKNYSKVTGVLSRNEHSDLSRLVRCKSTRAICFLALALQARLRFVHVIIMITLFNLIMCVAFMPLVLMRAVGNSDWEGIFTDQFLFVCQAASVFQINFLCFCLFVNTSMVFVSTVFPSQFTLRKVPLVMLLALILLLCLVHMTCVLVLTINQMKDVLFSPELTTPYDLEPPLKLALVVCLAVYLVTLAATIILFFLIFYQIYNTKYCLDRMDRDAPMTSTWYEILGEFNKQAIYLFFVSMVFYLLEAAPLLAVYNAIKPHWLVLVSHLAVNVAIPILHLPPCMPLTYMDDKERTRECHRVCQASQAKKKSEAIKVRIASKDK